MILGGLGAGELQKVTAQGSTNCLAPPAGLVSFWTGDGTAADIIGPNNGTLVGGVSYTSGEVGQAFNLDGVSGYVRVPDSPSLDPAGSFSVELWLNAGQSQTFPCPILDKSYQTTNDTGWGLRANFDGTVSFFVGVGSPFATNSSVSTQTNLLDSDWHHLAGVFVAGTNLQIYLDGALQNTLIQPFPPANNQGELDFGHSSDFGFDAYFLGLLDEVSYYNRALSGAEVASIYNAGSAGKCRSTNCVQVSCPGPISVSASEPAGAVVTWTNASAVDTCSGLPLEVTSTPPSGSLFPVGTNLVVCSAVNADGQSNSCMFSVTVTPATVPPPGYLQIYFSAGYVWITWTNPSAVLQTAPTPTGPWTLLPEATSPYPVLPLDTASFFRLTGLPLIDVTTLYDPPTFVTGIGNPVSSCDCTGPGNPNTPASPGGPQNNGNGSVYLHTGELVQYAVDLAIPGRGFDWRLERFYRSGMSYEGPLGHGWDFSHNRRLAVQTNGDVLRMDGLGRADKYVFVSSNVYQAPSGFYTRLTLTTNGYIERDRHGTQIFYSQTNSHGVAQMTAMLDRNSNQMTFQYNGLGQLVAAVDTLGRTNRYYYDGNDRLLQVADFSGRTVTFGYSVGGDLVSATSPLVPTGSTPNGNDFPAGKTTAYAYSPGSSDPRFSHKLLTVTAPNEVAVGGPPRLMAQYDTGSSSPNAGRLKSLQVGGVNASGVHAGGTLYFGFTTLLQANPGDFTNAAFQAVVTNRNGNVSQYQFNQLGNVLQMIQFTSGVRPGDPPGFTNTSGYNADGETIARTNAESDLTLYTFDSGNPDRFQQGNLLQVLRLPGPRGGDQTQILTSMTYETNFNFEATSTDARGNTVTNRYDASGNRTNTVERIASTVEDFQYNAYGQMTAHVLPDNGSGSRRRDVMTYYSSGTQMGYLQQSIVDSSGFNLTTTFNYDLVGNVIRTVDPRGNGSTNIVNALNQVVRTVSRAVSTNNLRYLRDTFYDANDNVVQVNIQNLDELGNEQSPAWLTNTTQFDILDQVISTAQQVTSNSFITNQMAYDANQNRLLMRSPEAVAGRQPANTVSNIYDERDLVFKVIRAPGDPGQSTSESDYDKNSNLIRALQGQEDTNGVRITTFGYDGYNRRTNSTDAMGNVSLTEYDANGNATNAVILGELMDVPGSAGNTNLAQTAYTFDQMDRLTLSDQAWFALGSGTTLGNGHVTNRSVYSANSQVLTNFDANGNPTATFYDTANRVLSMVDPKGNSVANVYDPNGNVLRVIETERSDLYPTNLFVFGTTNVYDNLDRLLYTVDNISNTNRSAYDSRNNRTLSISAKGNTIRFAFDGLSRLLTTARHLTSTGGGTGTNVGAITTTKQWDDDSRLAAQIDSNTNATRYLYDALNRQFATVYADTTMSTNGFDVHDDAIAAMDPNGTVVASQYDLLNRLVSKRIAPGPGVSTVTTNEGFAYDGLSRLVSATNNQTLVTRSYDSLGRLSSETQTLLSPTPVASTVVSQYDPAGNLISSQHSGASYQVFRQFDPLNRATNVLAGFPIAASASYSYVGPGRVERRTYSNNTWCDYGYDGARRVVGVTNYSSAGDVTNIIDARALFWDADYNKISRSDVRPSGLGQASLYSIDSADRLIRTLVTGFGATNRFYTLDGVGNRTDPGYSANLVNEYLSTPFDTRAYDLDGSLVAITGGTNAGTFTYDYRDLMVSAQRQGATANYVYDALGRRVAKTITNVLTRLLYDGWQEIEEQDTNANAQALYVFGNYIDEALVMRRGTTNSYYHADDLYNVTALTDASGGVVERYEYDDYGAPTFLTPGGAPLGQASDVGNAILFTGRRYDAETGWYDYRTRFLEPFAARFATRDTLGIWGDDSNLGNGATYVGDSPATGADPFGLSILISVRPPLTRRKSENVDVVGITTDDALGPSGFGSGCWESFIRAEFFRRSHTGAYFHHGVATLDGAVDFILTRPDNSIEVLVFAGHGVNCGIATGRLRLQAGRPNPPEQEYIHRVGFERLPAARLDAVRRKLRPGAYIYMSGCATVVGGIDDGLRLARLLDRPVILQTGSQDIVPHGIWGYYLGHSHSGRWISFRPNGGIFARVKRAGRLDWVPIRREDVHDDRGRTQQQGPTPIEGVDEDR